MDPGKLWRVVISLFFSRYSAGGQVLVMVTSKLHYIFGGSHLGMRSSGSFLMEAAAAGRATQLGPQLAFKKIKWAIYHD